MSEIYEKQTWYYRFIKGDYIQMKKNTAIKIIMALLMGGMFFCYYITNVEVISAPTSSYGQVLDLLMKQLRGKIPAQIYYGNHHGAVYPIFLAYCAKLLGITSPELVCYYMQGITLMVMVMSVFLCIEHLTEKIRLGVIASVCVVCLGYQYIVINQTYSYWGAPVTILISLPILCGLFKNIKKKNSKLDFIGLSIVVVIMIIGNIVRQHVALPILGILILYLCVKSFISRKKEVFILCMTGIVAIVLLFLYSEPAIHKMYDICSGELDMDNEESPWHAIWCGLGYYENEYGFEWNDSAAHQYVTDIDSGAAYCSKEYYEILKERVLKVAHEDIGFVIKTSWKKFVDSLMLGWKCFGRTLIFSVLLFVCVGGVFSCGKRKNLPYFIPSILLGGIIIITGVAQGVVGIPAEAYIYGSYAGYIYIITINIVATLDVLGYGLKREKKENVESISRNQKNEIKNAGAKGDKILYIICPCYNESENLESGYTFNKLELLMKELISSSLCSPQSRILMVNDGSSDNTQELLEKKHTENPLFSYINLSRNFGHQYALLCGLLNVRQYADVTITVDADLQQDINAVKEFLQKYYEGYEIVYGVRKSRESDGAFKKWSANLFYDMMEKMCGGSIIKNHADYRLMSKKALNTLAEFEETNLFLRGIIPLIGFKSCKVYFEVSPRRYGESKYTLKKMVKLAADGITSLSIKPIRMVFLGGTLIFSLSCLIAIGYFIMFLLGKNISGYTSIIMSLWLLGGMLMMSIGCVGEYIGKMYLETKKRPRYIVDSMKNDVHFIYEQDAFCVNMEEKKCIVCGGRLVSGSLQGLLVCERCGFITTDLEISEEEIKRLYSANYYNGEEYANYILDKFIIQKNFKKRLKHIEKYLNNTREAKLFEIGCAYGFFLQVAGQKFDKVAGIDISSEAITYARNTLKMEAYAGDFLAFENNEIYDVVCMWDTIEHLQSPELYIEKIYRILGNNGLICITTGDIGSLNARIRGQKWRQIHPPTHLHYFSRKTLKELLERKGFKVLNVSYPANILSLNTVLYTILCLKLKYKKLYVFLDKLKVTRVNIKINLHDFMFVIAQKVEK